MNFINYLDPIEHFSEFYSNPTIRALGEKQRWSVVDSELIPIHMRQLFDYGNIRAAHEVSGAALVTLSDLLEQLPQAANCTMFITSDDGVAAVIVNRAAPPELLNKLQQLPALYAEHAMNGREILLLVRTPKHLLELPAVYGTASLHAHKGFVQIIVQGWVTFSRNVLPSSEAAVMPVARVSPVFWDDHVLAFELLSINHETSAHVARAPAMMRLVNLMTRRPLQVQLSDTQGDVAAFEHAVLGELYRRLIPLVRNLKQETRLSHTGEAHLLYNAATLMLPHRRVNEEIVEPLLFDAARSTIIQQDFLKASPRRRTR